MNTDDTPSTAQAERGALPVVTGLLGEGWGIRLIQEDATTLRIEVEGEAPLRVPVRVVTHDGKTYLEVTLATVLKSPAVASVLRGRFALKRKSIRVHQLVAIIGRGAVLLGSDRGQVGIHHVNLEAGNNRAENLRAVSTATHNAWHRWIDGREAEAREAYLISIPVSADGLGEGLPDELRVAIATDTSRLEYIDDVAFDQEDEAAPGSERDMGGEGENSYYPLDEPNAGVEQGAVEALALTAAAPDETAESLQELGHRLGAPDDDELETMAGRGKKMQQVAEALGCDVTGYLLRRGYSTITVGAIQEKFAREGARFVAEGGFLYRYDEERGCYAPAGEAFECEVVSFAVKMAEEGRRIRIVTSVWPIKAAGKVLLALPKPKPANLIVQECGTSLYPLWRLPERMNGDQWTLNVANGLLDLRTQQLRSHGPEHLSSLQLPFPFAPAAGCPAWLGYLEAAVPDAATRDVLQEWFGYCLIPTTKYEKALFLFGGGGTGKSTFIKTLRKLVGEGNCAAVGLEDLGDKFRVGGLRDRLLNVVTEVNPTRALNDARFKAFVSGDPVTGEQKFKDPGVFQPFARFVVAANTPPRVLDQTDAFYRRVLMVRFEQKFVASPNPQADPPEKAQDPLLSEKLDAELSGILNWALAGLARLEERGRFDLPASLQANVRAFREDQDNALRFLHERCVFGPGLEVGATELYREYLAWCKAHGEKAHANNRFGQVVSNHPEVQPKKNGNKGRFYKGLRPADADALAGDGEQGGSGAPKAGVPPLPKPGQDKRSA